MYHAVSLAATSLVLLFALVAPKPLSKPNATACTDTVYVGDSSGQFYISKDAGATFTNVPLPSGQESGIHAIVAVGDNILIGTDDGLSLSTDAGQTWTLQDLSGDQGNKVNALYTDGKRIWAGVNKKTLAISDDNGATWPVNVEIPDQYELINNIYGVGGRTYVATADGLGISDDDGQTWTYVSESASGSNDVNAVGGNGDNVYVGMEANRGAMSISNDGGATWHTQDTAQSGRWNYVYSISATDTKAYGAIFGAGVTISDDGGSNWQVKGQISGLYSNYPSRVFALGDNVYVGFANKVHSPQAPGISVSHDDGSTFQRVNIGLRKDVTALFAQCV